MQINIAIYNFQYKYKGELFNYRFKLLYVKF